MAILCAFARPLPAVQSVTPGDPPDVLCEQTERAYISIDAGGKVFEYVDELIAPSDFTVAEEIQRRRINAPLPDKMELVDSYIRKGADHATALKLCFPRLCDTVAQVERYLYVAPADARIEYKNGRYTVVRERDGRALDTDSLYGSIYCCLKYPVGGTAVRAPTVKLPPSVTYDGLRSELVPRAEYTTDFSTSAAARAHNVTCAIKKFDGRSLAAGESMSFNAVVGPRTEENGFKIAKIIVDGKYVDGVGGGVCQASTAVYNAALRAGLIAAANSHSICPSYCPPGLDAMISSASDLVITNTTSRPVHFSVSVAGGKATVKIYGERQKLRVVPESELDAVIAHDDIELTDTAHAYFDEGTARGVRLLVSPGKDGYESSTYLNYYDGDTLVDRVKIRVSSYKPSPRVVAVSP